MNTILNFVVVWGLLAVMFFVAFVAMEMPCDILLGSGFLNRSM